MCYDSVLRPRSSKNDLKYAPKSEKGAKNDLPAAKIGAVNASAPFKTRQANFTCKNPFERLSSLYRCVCTVNDVSP
jgi:hypothetical protein